MTVAAIPLRNRQGEVVAQAIIDEVDFDWLNQWRWSRNSGYACRGLWTAGKVKSLSMHRLILGLVDGDPREGEHRDRNRLNNHRWNLRIAPSHALNMQNVPARRGTRGAYYVRDLDKWKAQVMLNRKVHYLGLFATEDEAGEAAAQFRREHMPFSVEEQNV